MVQGPGARRPRRLYDLPAHPAQGAAGLPVQAARPVPLALAYYERKGASSTLFNFWQTGVGKATGSNHCCVCAVLLVDCW